MHAATRGRDRFLRESTDEKKPPAMKRAAF